MFGEGTDRENNKKPYFPVIGGFALDDGGCMNNARQSIHGAPNRTVEDTHTALGNQFVGLQIRFEGGG